ncbi:superoxide dismutase family protein [Aliidiomarina taiwanensis]|uniref:Superoxide dismutase family protein n=1 Tax=Aliidiomarina taiwanensis TaxID=946228 RepID=A0A432WVQ7_9GAMM|nr:superoxide dismutase family protein [Aliidiomarina taiwanensis]RUO37860.1 superoxide dismutase family protein [Aliidiomarina taiwanensis]
MLKRTFIGLALVASLSACNSEPHHHITPVVPGTTYSAHLMPTAGNEGLQGTIHFEQKPQHVSIRVHVEGLPANSTHGFHVHEFGDCSAPDATSAGSHFNPQETAHGGPDSSERHVGDLGNIESNAQGVAVVELADTALAMEGAHNILGRAVVIHSQHDDLTSQPVGNAGSRLLCGVIGVAKTR